MEPKVLILRFTLCLSIAGPVVANPGFWSEQSIPERVETIVAEMTVEELVAQTLMVGYAGGYPTDEFLTFVETAGVGGVKVFGWNAGDLVELARGIAAMQAAAFRSRSGVPLLIATDQEGGWVRHVKGATSDTPGNLAIGASGLAIDAYETAFLIGSELKILGINMNFAPTVDVYTNPDADVIGPRAFSSDPAQTALLGLSFYRGLEGAGVIATAKHFPGHGNTSDDSHGTLPVISDSIETIWDRDLLPYRVLVAEGVPAIMSGHLSFPEITGASVPATLSDEFLRGILRGDLGFSGIIITDDMRMYGVLQNGTTVKEACQQALLAGNDMILISRDYETQIEVYEHVVESARADSILREAIAESVRRIVGTKLKYLSESNPEDLKPDPDTVLSRLPFDAGQSALFDLACRSVAIVAAFNVPLPAIYTDSGGTDLLLVGQYPAFIAEGLRRFPNANTHKIPFTALTDAQMDEIATAVSESGHTIFCLANEEGSQTLEGLQAYRNDLTVFSVLTPVYLRKLEWVISAIAAFGRGISSFRAGFAVLSGDYLPEGRAPIPLFAEAD